MIWVCCSLVLGAEGAETVVTGTRTPRTLDDAPVQTIVIPRSELERSPTALTDELVRTQAVAQTFRRSSSIAADPTSQGLSLRGIGPSGVSRASLLVDGVPMNDGYGGWVYWRALPRLGLDRLELVPGAASAQYGSGALGGVVQLFTRPIERFSFDATALLGTQDTMEGAGRVAGSSGWSTSLPVRWRLGPTRMAPRAPAGAPSAGAGRATGSYRTVTSPHVTPRTHTTAAVSVTSPTVTSRPGGAAAAGAAVAAATTHARRIRTAAPRMRRGRARLTPSGRS